MRIPEAQAGSRTGVGSRASPEHVAIIMDGNGRWARARGLPRVAGHRAGAQAVRRAIEAAVALRRELAHALRLQQRELAPAGARRCST